MTKAELVEKMANDAGISKVAAKAAFDSFLDAWIQMISATQPLGC